MSLSHRSVQRTLSALVDRGWAEKREGRYRLTTTGRLVAREHETHLDTLDRIEAFAPLYRHLPESAAPPPRLLAGADLVTATDADPQAAVNAYLTRVRALDTIVADVEVEAGATTQQTLSLPPGSTRVEVLLDGTTAAAGPVGGCDGPVAGLVACGTAGREPCVAPEDSGIEAPPPTVTP